ncbi:anti-sigma factor family protein [Syntrophomonas palmitatica]|uniref:anti-sigma factor family protein n=1 Tax=Syntrophomonas palmitatica TaxID=402877 RepID=UPI0006CF4B4F|nr:zf-HC2 domain-containing protein [Syntrophomonas palmitatica]
MNCQQVNNLIWDYCDGLLSPESRAEFETHLNECNACNELTRLTSLENEAIKTLPDMVVSDNFTSQLMLTIASPGSQAAVYPFSVSSSRRKFAFGPFSLIGAIAALLLMCFSFWPDLQHNQIAMDNITENRPGKQVIKPDAAASKSAKQTPDKSKLGWWTR